MKRLDAKQEARGRGGGCVLVVRPLGTPQMWVTLQLLAGGCQRNDPLLAKALATSKSHIWPAHRKSHKRHSLSPSETLKTSSRRGRYAGGGKFVGYPAVVVDGVIA